jgi:hypothetical protein
MEKEVKQPGLNDLFVDARPCIGYTVDLQPGERQGLRVQMEGFDESAAEVIDNQEDYGERAGISDKDFQGFVTTVERRNELRKHLRVARKLVEILEESEAVHDDQAQRQIFGFAQVAEARARAYGDPEILARYEKTRAYRSAVGVKAAKTRRRNEADLEQPQNDDRPEELLDQVETELPAAESAR